MGWDWSNGENGRWLPKSGTHLVRIVGAKVVYANSGNKGIEVTLADRDGRKVKDVFWNTEKAVSRNWYICNCLGFTAEEFQNVTPKTFIDKYCQITTKPDGSYTAVDEWSPWTPKDRSEEFYPDVSDPEPRPMKTDRRWAQETANDDVPF